MTVATENTQLNRCGSVPLKLYLQKQAVGHIWSTGHNLSTPSLMLETDIEKTCHSLIEKIHLLKNTVLLSLSYMTIYMTIYESKLKPFSSIALFQFCVNTTLL